MSDTPCTEADLHPQPGDVMMMFKAVFYIEMTEDDAKSLANDEGNGDDYSDDPVEATVNNLEYQIESCCEWDWTPNRVEVSSIK